MKRIGEFKCIKCGWVHVGLDEQDVLADVSESNAYALQKGRGDYPVSVDSYRRCFRCHAPSADFVVAGENDAPVGCTLQAVIAPFAP